MLLVDINLVLVLMVGKYLLLLLFSIKVLLNFALPSTYAVKIVQLMPMCIK